MLKIKTDQNNSFQLNKYKKTKPAHGFRYATLLSNTIHPHCDIVAWHNFYIHPISWFEKRLSEACHVIQPRFAEECICSLTDVLGTFVLFSSSPRHKAFLTWGFHSTSNFMLLHYYVEMHQVQLFYKWFVSKKFKIIQFQTRYYSKLDPDV